jgi:hypothetical protein
VLRSSKTKESKEAKKFSKELLKAVAKLCEVIVVSLKGEAQLQG